MVGFDRNGGRLGYGGGFYDRTLEYLRSKQATMAIGFAYSQQEKLTLKDKIESGKHPQTDEGLVIYKLDDAIPVKAKIKHDLSILPEPPDEPILL